MSPPIRADRQRFPRTHRHTHTLYTLTHTQCSNSSSVRVVYLRNRFSMTRSVNEHIWRTAITRSPHSIVPHECTETPTNSNTHTLNRGTHVARCSRCAHTRLLKITVVRCVFDNNGHSHSLTRSTTITLSFQRAPFNERFPSDNYHANKPTTSGTHAHTHRCACVLAAI